MASPGQIQIYSPARQLPAGFTGRQAPAPVRPNARQVQAGRKATPALTGRWAALDPYVQAETDKATQARAQAAAEKAQKEAADAAYKKLPWWKRGIATAVDNPIVKVALAPAEALSVPMKAIALGKQELSSHLPRGAAEFLEHPFQWEGTEFDDVINNLLKIVPLSPFGVDTDKARAEERGVLERLAPRSDYGHGQILTGTGKEGAKNQWGDRFQGLGADIVNDPLMLLEGGGTISRPALLAGDAAKISGKTQPLIRAAEEAAEVAGRLSQERNALGALTGLDEGVDEAARLARRAQEVADQAPTTVIRPERTVKAPKNLDERLSMASEWQTENPALVKQHFSEVTKGVKQGFEAMSAEARAAFGVDTGGIRLRGVHHDIPGTKALRQVWKDAGGVRREVVSNALDKALGGSDALMKLRNMRVTKGLEPVAEAFRKGDMEADTVGQHLTTVFTRNNYEVGKGQFQSRGASYLKQAMRSFRRDGEEATRQLVRDSQVAGEMTPLNQLFKDINDLHTELTGKALVSSIDPSEYIPNIPAPKWRRAMKRNPDSPAAKAYMDLTGMTTDDLLENSHFLDKRRKFVVPEGQTEAKFKFGDREVTLRGNTLDDKNAALAEAFPEWKGEFYTTDPAIMGEVYLNSLASDAGARYAVDQLADTGSEEAKRLIGSLWDEYDARNAAYRQQSFAARVTDVTKQGYSRGQSLDDVAEAPEIQPSEYFAGTKDTKATEQLAEDIKGAGQQWLHGARKDIQTVQEEAKDVIEGLRKDWAEGLRLAAKADNPRIKELLKVVEAVKELVRGYGVGKITSDNAGDVARSLTKIDDVIANLQKELSKTKRVWNGKITREGKKIDAELAEQLRILKGERQKLEDHVSEVGSRLRAEITERRAWINGDVADAERVLADKEATIPKPSPADPEVMDGILNRLDGKATPPPPDGVSEFQSHPAYERMVDDYGDALRRLQASREDGRLAFKNGKPTPEGRKLLDEVQAAQKALREAQGSITPAEFEKVFARHEAANVAVKDAVDNLDRAQRGLLTQGGETVAELQAKLGPLQKELVEANAELQRVYDIQKTKGRPFEQTVNGRKVLTNADTDIVQQVGVDAQGRGRYKVGEWRIEPTSPHVEQVKVRDTGPKYARTTKPTTAPEPKVTQVGKPVRYQTTDVADLYDITKNEDGQWVLRKKSRKRPNGTFRSHAEAEEAAKLEMGRRLRTRLAPTSTGPKPRFEKRVQPRWKVINPEGDVVQATVTYEAAHDYALAGHLEDMEAPAFYFHGTGQSIDEFTTRGGGDPFAQLHGAGLYTTENPPVGRQYRNKGMTMDEGEMYRVSGPKGKFLDIDKPMPQDARSAIERVLDEEVTQKIGPRPPNVGDPPVPDGYVRVYGGHSDPPGWWMVEPELGTQEYLDFDSAKGYWFTTDRDRAKRGSGQYGEQKDLNYRDIPVEQYEQLKGMANVAPEHQERLAGLMPDTDIVLTEDLYWNTPQGESLVSHSSKPHDLLEELQDFILTHGRDGADLLRGVRETIQQMQGAGTFTREEAEDILWKINQALEAEGYVALKHTGGGLMGGGRDHNVKIWLDPGKVTINDVMDKQGSYANHQRELAKARGEFEGLGGADAYPNGEPPRKGPHDPNARVQPNTEAWMDWRLWQTTKEDIQNMERQLLRGGKFHEEQQARNWATHQANYNNVLADATKDERAAVEAARAARDARAGQRESIIRSGPEVGDQVWPGEYDAGVARAKEELAAKEASYTPPFSPQKTEKARRLAEEEARLIKWHEQGNMTTPAYEAEKKRIVELRADAHEELKAQHAADRLTIADYRNRRTAIDSDAVIALNDLEERFAGRLNDEEFVRRMRVIEAEKKKLQLGPKVADKGATQAAQDAARERLRLKEQAPSRVIGEDDIAEGVVKPEVAPTKVVNHGDGKYVVSHPETGRKYTITKSKGKGKPTWKVKLPSDRWPVREFPTLREATEYARDDMARGLAQTSAERKLLPPLEPREYAKEAMRQHTADQMASDARRANQELVPGQQDVISADDWFKANVRSATGPERQALREEQRYADQRKRFAAAAPEPDPRWTEPLGGFGYEERRLVGADKPKQLKGGAKDVANAYIEAAERNGQTPEQAIENARKNLEGVFYKNEVDDILQGIADHYYAQSGRGEPQIARHVERINTPPQPEAFKTSAISAETGDLVGVPSPRTEGEAVAYLEQQLHPGTENIVPGSELHKKVVEPLEAAQAAEAKRAAEVPFESAERKAKIDAEWGAERDAEINEISKQQNVFGNLKKDLTERESLLRKRKDVETLRKKLMTVPRRGKNDELIHITEQLLDIAKANPMLDDQALNAAESLLHTHLEALQAIEGPKALGRQVKYLMSDDAIKNMPDVMRAVLNDNWKAMHDGLLVEGDVIVSARLRTAMENFYKMSDEPGLLGRTFNAYTNLFKTYATLSPGFQVRNIMSGIFMNTADGVGLRTQLNAVKLWRGWEQGGNEWLRTQSQEIRHAFNAAFASGAGGRVAEAGIAGKSAGRGLSASLYNVASSNPATRGFQRWGEKVEGSLRLAMAMDSIKRGESIVQATRRIGRVHFNYAEVSEFDEMAKRLIPFWTFMSRNLPLQMQEIMTNPAAYAAYGHVKRNFSGAPEENTPEYWKGLGTWRLPFDIAGKSAYYQPDFGFTRMGQDVQNITDTLTMRKPLAALNSLNPGIAAPADFLYGTDSFTGRKYGPNDYSEASGPVGNFSAAVGSLFGQVNEAGQVSDNWMNLMRSINPIQDRITRLAPASVGESADAARTAESWLRWGGIPYRTLSPKQQEAEAMRKYYAMLDEASRQTAMAREAAS